MTIKLMKPLTLLIVSSLIVCLIIALGMPSQAFVYPLLDTRISSKFGKRERPVANASRHHSGVDLPAPHDSDIRAIRDGVVVFADPHAGYGNLVVIMHKDDYTSHYGHCNKILVQPGQKVKAGAIIAKVGSTGISSGPHLHLEIRRRGKALNPLKLIPDLTAKAEG